MSDLPPPPPALEVEVVVVHAPRLPPLGGEAVFAVQQLDAGQLKTAPRLDAALKQAPGVSLFRRTGSGRPIPPSKACRFVASPPPAPGAPW